jgi:hypothetical protein
MADFTKAVDAVGSPFRAFRDDPKGTLLKMADSGQRVPITTTKTSFSLTIHATSANRRGVIGAVSEISVRQSFVVDEEYDVHVDGRGLPRELVPQIMSSRTLRLNRYDLYTQTLEQVFGSPTEIILSAKAIGPISMRLTWRPPERSTLGAIVVAQSTTSVYEYGDCYITDIGRTMSTNNVIVGADATLVWRTLRQLQ